MTSRVVPIAIAGAGPVAQTLGYLLTRRGSPVAVVASRTAAQAGNAARFIGNDVTPADYKALGRLAHPTLIAVTDTALPEVVRRIAATATTPSLALHTCGVAGPDVLAPLRQRGWSCGILHPMQTIPTRDHGITHVPGTTFGIGGDADAAAWANSLVERLEGRPLHIRPDAFALYHAAAVVAGNGMFAILEAASQLLQQAGVPRSQTLDALAPLARTSLANALLPDAPARLTGPVARGDLPTVRAHLDALRQHEYDEPSALAGQPLAATLYTALTAWLLVVARHRGGRSDSQHHIQQLIEAHVRGEGYEPSQSASS